MMYEIRRQSGAGDFLGSISATSHEEAATTYARRLYGSTRWADRVTGQAGLSGCFQPYKRLGGGASSIGSQIHVHQVAS
jgi:hypothetical protein